MDTFLPAKLLARYWRNLNPTTANLNTTTTATKLSQKHTICKLNLKKNTQKLTRNERQIDFRTEYILCAYRCSQLLHRTQHGTVLIIFPLNTQKIAKMHLCDFDIDENRAGFSFKRKNFGVDNGCAHGFHNTQITCTQKFKRPFETQQTKKNYWYHRRPNFMSDWNFSARQAWAGNFRGNRSLLMRSLSRGWGNKVNSVGKNLLGELI